MMNAAAAQLISTPTPLTTLPAVPMTVADCNPGQHWGKSPSHGGLLRCLTNNPPAPPTCPPGYWQTAAPSWDGEAWSGLGCAPATPARPSCFFQTGAGGTNGYFVDIYGDDPGNLLYVVYWNSPLSATPAASGVLPFSSAIGMNQLDAEAWVDAQLAGSGYSRGALQIAYSGNGNVRNTMFYQACH